MTPRYRALFTVKYVRVQAGIGLLFVVAVALALAACIKMWQFCVAISSYTTPGVNAVGEPHTADVPVNATGTHVPDWPIAARNMLSEKLLDMCQSSYGESGILPRGMVGGLVGATVKTRTTPFFDLRISEAVLFSWSVLQP
jgi:hypothetical protein